MYCTNTLRIVIISIAMVLAFVATFGLLLPFNELFTVFSLFNTRTRLDCLLSSSSPKIRSRA